MTIRFAAIGINHNHIFGQVDALLGAGGEFVAFHAPKMDMARFLEPAGEAGRRA